MKNRSIKQFYSKLLNERKKFLIQEQELDTTSVDTQIDRYLQNYEREAQKNNDDEQESPESSERTGEQDSQEQRESTQRTLKQHFRMLFEDDADELIDTILKGKGKGKQDDEEPVEEPAQDMGPAAGGGPEQLPQDIDINAVGQDLPPAEGEEEQPPEQGADAAGAPPMGGGMPIGAPGSEDEQMPNGPEMQDEENPEDTSVQQRPGQLDLGSYVMRVSHFIENAQNLLDIKAVILRRALDIVKKNYGDKDADKFRRMLRAEYKDSAPEDIDSDLE